MLRVGGDIMTNVAGYDSSVFAGLPTIGGAYRNLARIRPELDRLGRVLERNGLADIVHLSLMHRHFAMGEDERLIERVDPSARESRSAVRVPESNSNLVPHVLKATYDANTDTIVWFPTEFVEVDSLSACALQNFNRTASNVAFLEEFGRELLAVDGLDAIGLSVTHGREDIACDDGEVLVETTSEAERTLHMRPKQQWELDPATTIETVWLFDGKTCRMSCTCQMQGKDHNHSESN